MLRLFLLLGTVVLRVQGVAGRSRSELVLENIALRQQVGVLKQKRSRPRRDDVDRAFWVAMRVAWRAFLKSQAEGIWACDMFVATTLTFRRIYVLIIIAHATRELVHIVVTN